MNLVSMQTCKDMEEQNESRTDRRTQQGVELRVVKQGLGPCLIDIDSFLVCIY